MQGEGDATILTQVAECSPQSGDRPAPLPGTTKGLGSSLAQSTCPSISILTMDGVREGVWWNCEEGSPALLEKPRVGQDSGQHPWTLGFSFCHILRRDSWEGGTWGQQTTEQTGKQEQGSQSLF
jgi:hypothetical protein